MELSSALPDGFEAGIVPFRSGLDMESSRWISHRKATLSTGRSLSVATSRTAATIASLLGAKKGKTIAEARAVLGPRAGNGRLERLVLAGQEPARQWAQGATPLSAQTGRISSPMPRMSRLYCG